MGPRNYYLGEVNIPKEKRQTYAEQALKLLRAGGMMSIKRVNLYGRKLQLLYHPEWNEEGFASGNYNYYEDADWDTWRLDAETGRLDAGRIGEGDFCQTVLVAKVLAALYSQSFCLVAVDSDLIREKNCVGWINHVLGTAFTNERATRIWDIVQLLHRENWDEQYYQYLDYLWLDYPMECVNLNQFEPYIAVCHPELLQDHKFFIEEEDIAQYRTGQISVGLGYALFQAVLKRYHKAGGTLDGALKYLCLPRQTKEIPQNNEVQQFLFTRQMMTPAMAVALTAKEFDAEFWPLWDEIGEKVPQPCQYPQPKPCTPVEPISTQDFFKLNPDDMVYWWTREEPVVFSPELEKWMKELRAELDHISETIPSQDFLASLAENIVNLGAPAFRDMLYEFVERQNEQRVQAAVILMGRLAERKSPYGRQYQALLANKELRQQVLGF